MVTKFIIHNILSDVASNKQKLQVFLSNECLSRLQMCRADFKTLQEEDIDEPIKIEPTEILFEEFELHKIYKVIIFHYEPESTIEFLPNFRITGFELPLIYFIDIN